MTMIPKRLSTALINSLSAGVVPRIGLEHIAVGRKREIETLLEDLANVEEGGASFRIISGRYGSGKSFMLQLLRNYALDRGFVVADADLSNNRRLASSSGQAVSTYRELVTNLATATKPDGGALPALIDRWISDLMSAETRDSGRRLGDPGFNQAVEERIHAVSNELQGMVHGYDFATVLSSYWRGFLDPDREPLKTDALRWLRGEITTKTDANRALGVRTIVDDASWYDHIKLLTNFAVSLGYKGLVLLIDEAVNLYKIVNTQSRTSNYEMVLTILNDTLQGKASHLAVLIGGTPQMIEDDRRGLFSYEALRSRLSSSRFATDGLIDMSSPIISLSVLEDEEMFHLLQRVLAVYESHHKSSARLTDPDLITFMEGVLNKLGAQSHLTPRELIRDFIGALNIVRQYPERSFAQVIGSDDFVPSTENAVASNAENRRPRRSLTQMTIFCLPPAPQQARPRRPSCRS